MVYEHECRIHNCHHSRMDRIMDSPEDRLREENIPSFNPRPKVKQFTDPKLIKDPKKLNGWKWYHTRREYLMYHPYCAKCGNLGEEVHHVYPRHSHPHLIYKWNNLLTLCKECHKKEHREEEHQ
jgi:5-methylcytosine-specific restriction endonuclease McrA